MQNRDDLKRFRLGTIDDQIRIHREKPYVGGGRVAPPVAAVWAIRKVGKLAAYDGFNAIRGVPAAFFFEAAPDFYEIARCLWRQQCSAASFRPRFEPAQMRVQFLFGNALAALQFLDAIADLRVNATPVRSKPFVLFV